VTAATVAARLRALRKHAHLTQRQLAEKIGVDTMTVYRWEAGRQLPNGTFAIRLWRLFGLPVDALN